MKLCTYMSKDGPHVGIVSGSDVIDSGMASMIDVIRNGAKLSESGARIPLASVKFLAPIARPGKIFAIGLNYADHVKESGVEAPKEQLWFTKAQTSINGPYDPIQIPKVSQFVDYEVELVAVIGKRGKNLTRENAAEHIFGYCVGNDVTERMWQHRTPQWSLGKSFDTHAPIGPWITTADEVPDPHALDIKCWVNGEQRQNSNTKHLIFNIFDQMVQLSAAMTLEPGDLIFTGTPGGVGAAMDPRQFLKAGDKVRCEIEKLGAIEAVCAPEVSTMDCDVLIVGAGPVGAALAGLLADEGLSVIVCERSEEIYPLPRAAHLDHEAMRIFQRLGVIEKILPHTRATNVYEFRTAGGEVLLRFDNPPGPASNGWPASNMIHQPAIELALRDKLRDAPGVTLNIPWAFASLAQDANGVIATFDTPDGAKTIRARYAVGCDGSSSAVRKALDVDLFDYDFDEPWLVVDVLVSDPSKLPDMNLQICDPKRPTTCVLMGPGRHRWEFMLKPGEEPEAMLKDGVVEELLVPWNLPEGCRIERRAVYRFHALVAKEWRKGRVLLAGDAAHQMPPFAGQGLCSGLRDAVNLSWKLAMVLPGEAGEAVLNTYQVEREPHVRSIIDLALMMGRTVCVLDPAAAAARDAGMLEARKAAGGARPAAELSPPIAGGMLSEGGGALFPQPLAHRGARTIHLDDVLGRSAWLIARSDVPSGAQFISLTIDDARLEPFRADILRWMDGRKTDAVLVRPDRTIFGTGAAGELARAYAAALAP